MSLPSPKISAAITLAIAISGLLAALHLQYVMELAPCPWCVIQRFFLLLIALGATLQLTLPSCTRTYSGWFTLASALGGLGAAGWHSLQMVMPAKPEQTCGPGGFSQWIDSLWITDQLPWLLAPMGDCFKDAAKLFGLDLPILAFALFLGVTGLIAKTQLTRNS